MLNKRIIDLTDITLIIPIRIDSEDRIRNLNLAVNYINNFFDVNLLVSEYDSNENIPKDILSKNNVTHFFIKSDSTLFYKTKCINESVKQCKTNYIGIYDADVLLKPYQYTDAVNLLRSKEADIVYPYDGNFLNVPPKYISTIIEKLSLDFINISKCSVGLGMPELSSDRQSFGGAVFFNREKFIEGGMANEYIIGYGPEDVEIPCRFKQLGYKFKRVNGPIFHLTHQKSLESSEQHLYAEKNHEEFRKVFSMKKEKLREYVSTWPWCKSAIEKDFETTKSTSTEYITEEQLLAKLQKDFRNVSALTHLAELELQRSNQKKARNYLIAALAIEPQNPAAKALWEKLH